MLEEMRQARNAGRIVHRAHLEPQHLRDDRGAVIGDHQHLHAVLQRELEDLRRWRGLARRRRRAAARRGADPAQTAVSATIAAAAILEPVKPAAGFFLGGRRRLAGLASARAERLPFRTRSVKLWSAAAAGCAQSGLQFGADGGIGILRPGIGQQHALAQAEIAAHAGRHGLRDRSC